MDEFTGRRFELAASTDGLTVIVEPLEIIQIVLHSDKRMTFTWQRIKWHFNKDQDTYVHVSRYIQTQK